MSPENKNRGIAPAGRALTAYQLWYGRNEPPPERTALRAGQLTAFLEGADLRDMRFGGIELVRRLYFALRDENWDTIPGELTNLSVSVRENSFLVSFDSQHRHRDLGFRWHGAIEGSESGGVTYTMSGEALSGFRYCRIGFCVLHPPEYAGRPFRGITPGWPIAGELPTTVGPQRYEGGLYYPLFDAVSSLTVPLSKGIEAKFDFEGDLFEMEDQRNWTDGSFKTYGTPLSLGYPHTARSGQAFTQRVTIQAHGPGLASRAPTDAVHVSLEGSLGRKLPRLGLGIASHDAGLSQVDQKQLAGLHLDHLRADVHLNTPAARTQLSRAAEECRALGCGLELALFLTDDAGPALDALASLFPLSVAVSRILVFHESEQVTAVRWVRQVRDRLGALLPDVPIGGGTNLYFAELNRSRPDAAGFDAVAYSVNPQVHASDERSLVENLEAQRDTVNTARLFCGAVPVVVSPVTLKPRFNPDAVGPEPAARPGELPPAVDPRQMSLFAAAWTLGSVKQLAEAGADSVTYYETTGWRGIKETDRGCPEPELFCSTPGMVFPVYHVFAGLADLKTAELLSCSSTAPLQVQAVALRGPEGISVLVANLTAENQPCTLGPLEGHRAQVRTLDSGTAPEAMADPDFFSHYAWAPLDDSRIALTLAPYSITRIDEHPDWKEGS